jgi:hypothetical protein
MWVASGKVTHVRAGVTAAARSRSICLNGTISSCGHCPTAAMQRHFIQQEHTSFSLHREGLLQEGEEGGGAHPLGGHEQPGEGRRGLEVQAGRGAYRQLQTSKPLPMTR